LSQSSERPRGSRAAEQRDELASFQLIEVHSVPVSQGRDCRISNWRRIVSGYRSGLYNLLVVDESG
jgi:hypothetical protein